jgi:SAM-dependent methyltransferase
MSYLLFPGRHLLNTRFQEEYLHQVLAATARALPGLQAGPTVPKEPITQIIFAITSSNQANSRYNPVPFYIRAIGVDRFARSLQASVPFSIFGIPHYGHTTLFADFTIKEIADQSEGMLRLTPSNCYVLCSTPAVIELYQKLGYSILTAEQTQPGVPTPIDLVREVAAKGDGWQSSELLTQQLTSASWSLFKDFSEVPRRIIRLYNDPLVNQEGSLTEKRNYNTYARGMNEIIRLKYLDICEAIRPGRIVDEGCADGALLAEISEGFPDSDLYGIDLSAEFAHRFEERRRAGDFGGSYVHFFLRNLLDPVFEPESLDTTICNSTLHELWSYANGEASVRSYLTEKYRQLRQGGRLVVRDVVGPESADETVLLWCNSEDGESPDGTALAKMEDRSQAALSRLSTRARFHLFARDFLKNKPARQTELVQYQEETIGGRPVLRLSRRLAAEFLSKKDYIDNWTSEMNEEFCFWDFEQWRQAMTEIGFQVIESFSRPTQGSRIYCNPWTVEHRYKGKVELLSADQPNSPLAFPPTNMVLVAEK